VKQRTCWKSSLRERWTVDRFFTGSVNKDHLFPWKNFVSPFWQAMLRKLVGNRVEACLNGTALVLNRHKISPNTLTLIGLAVNGVGAYCYYRGFLVAAGIIILAAGLFDMLDGAVARAGNKVSEWGGFFDSVVDRYSDFLILGGILAHFSKLEDSGMTLLLVVILCGTFLVSYVRARAELVIPRCAVGLMERPERIILLSAGSIFGFFHTALWILAITTHITALHRIWYTRSQC
jgi:CDP-diacylglycerol--glycerol-3-phosphate 3-phosphatidyltransferase